MVRNYSRTMTASRYASWLAALVILAGILAFSLVLWLQFAQGEQPCSICVYQRLADLAVIVIVTMGFFWKGTVRQGLWILAALYALLGAALAGWQWHLTQMAADQIETCSSVQVFQSSPALGGLGNDLASTLSGHGSCALAGSKSLAGWPITHWSMVFFLGCAVLLLVAQWLSRRVQT
ncbi:disulfide bond formation protein DsbB [Acidithiobacillus thiooxidans]|uniref:Disulfide bond formation protein DsbB n=2 Tax=Acidithiobacillus thiooxidans TaxID=930 RepID=A0A1C2HXI5_ACITH|nr:disulfide bond formation protein DsbB [Acidithiobacillus thiooxidans]OCX75279.1 disulfide bond formation protein DsbB [Acidithiobacillus thiooxidans]OCX77152.1 disulfide bond formation protein DsbB [Acidithiobacillus thiooxidans]OCX82554.1 disulfide bond formation protein DsbB [Acidithiobacillus thiooxidans]OCX88045.1 disulfide bond formation protein DsbB [Acidithiobacillus thiooxidans]